MIAGDETQTFQVSGVRCQVSGTRIVNADTSNETPPAWNSEKIERRTSNPPQAHPILMMLRFIYFKTSESR
jgi:hypothetical protein